MVSPETYIFVGIFVLLLISCLLAGSCCNFGTGRMMYCCDPTLWCYLNEMCDCCAPSHHVVGTSDATDVEAANVHHHGCCSCCDSSNQGVAGGDGGNVEATNDQGCFGGCCSDQDGCCAGDGGCCNDQDGCCAGDGGCCNDQDGCCDGGNGDAGCCDGGDDAGGCCDGDGGCDGDCGD